MCQHQPSCPPTGAPDRQAARVVVSHPQQGWSLLCNGVVAFDDTGVGTPAAARLFQRWVASLHARGLLAAEPALRRLQVPTLTATASRSSSPINPTPTWRP